MPKSAKKIHIISFDVPCPANYGGVIDIYFKVKSFYNQGIEVILHCFKYGREESDELEKICSHVYYYSRRSFQNPFYGSQPYIVSSRNSAELMTNLLKDGNPILFEGLHCTYFLSHKLLKERFKIVRTHNIEHHYYSHLEKSESKYFKKYFFRIEADRLKKYQNTLKHADLIAAISPNDTEYLSKKFNNVIYIPAFHSNLDPIYPGKKGKYVLYHGNLGVSENYEAARELILHVFSKLKVQAVIAGNNPPKDLIRLIDSYSNVKLISGTNTERLHTLIKQAHINVLHTSQDTGIKLKLLNALYRGKFTLVNPLMVNGTGLEKQCIISKDFSDMVIRILDLMKTDFSKEEFASRIKYLEQNFSNETSIKKLISKIDFNPISQTLVDQKRVLRKGNLTLFSGLISYFLP